MIASLWDYVSHGGGWPGIFRSMAAANRHFALIGSSSVLISVGGVRLAVDPVLRKPLTGEPFNPAELFAELDAVLITHEHQDHFDTELIRELAQLPLTWVLPSFFNRQVISKLGMADRIVWHNALTTIHIKSVGITAFPSPHSTAGKTSGPLEHGYCIESENLRLLLPADVRDYAAAQAVFSDPADTIFLNVWLGKKNALNIPCEPYLTELCQFAVSLRPERIFLTHLYEASRGIEDIWTNTHAGLIRKRLASMCPGLRVLVPCPGDIISL